MPARSSTIFSVKSLGWGEMNVRRSRPGRRADVAAEIAEIRPRRVVPRVDGLPDEDDLAGPSRDPLRRLVEDVGSRPMIEAAADVRHDAERAIVRAATLDRNEGAQVRERIGHAVGRAAHGEAQHVVAASSEPSCGVVPAKSDGPGRELIAQAHELFRAEDRVDVRRRVLHAVAILLGQTARHDQTHDSDRAA